MVNLSDFRVRLKILILKIQTVCLRLKFFTFLELEQISSFMKGH
jgi:hypothetical protein